ncbi:MAG: hypothetical protein EBW14_08815, partial [Oxalobacteraceae bacterium]|nr:hypothetical protein [Oxalobacteraceae bacterium]
LLDMTIQQRGLFHLWCHSIDIEQLQLWQQLDAFLCRVARDIGTKQRLYNRELLQPLPAQQASITPTTHSDD